ncbi:MAG: hypothetical protein MHPSP_003078, partial [Paramarteilia canceri]
VGMLSRVYTRIAKNLRGFSGEVSATQTPKELTPTTISEHDPTSNYVKSSIAENKIEKRNIV